MSKADRCQLDFYFMMGGHGKPVLYADIVYGGVKLQMFPQTDRLSEVSLRPDFVSQQREYFKTHMSSSIPEVVYRDAAILLHVLRFKMNFVDKLFEIAGKIFVKAADCTGCLMGDFVVEADKLRVEFGDGTKVSLPVTLGCYPTGSPEEMARYIIGLETMATKDNVSNEVPDIITRYDSSSPCDETLSFACSATTAGDESGRDIAGDAANHYTGDLLVYKF